MSLYLSSFSFPDQTQEDDLLFQEAISPRVLDRASTYPFHILSKVKLEEIHFSPITLLSGENGVGKSTALKIISSKLHASHSPYFEGRYLSLYLDLCDYSLEKVPTKVAYLSSNDVFAALEKDRDLDLEVEKKRREARDEYQTIGRETTFREALDRFNDGDPSLLEKKVELKKKTESRYVRESAERNVEEKSNGEKALEFWEGKIEENALYLLDEPENSLSPLHQEDLAQFIEDSVRFYSCQFIISSHSPFFLSLKGGKVIDLDDPLHHEKKWTDLPNMKAYREFFLSREEEFKGK